MSLVTKVAATVLGAMAVVACSSAPPKTALPSAASAPVNTSSGTSASAATGTTASGAAAPAQINPKLVSQGYKAVKYRGAYVYCRSESVTGTQFQKKVCLTETAIKDIEAKTQETVDGMNRQRTGPACFQGTNC